MLTVHGCPLARLGEKDAGGMNVYVRELGKGLGRLGLEVDIFTRCQDSGTIEITTIGPGARVIHLEAGEPRWLPKNELYAFLPQFLTHVDDFRRSERIHYDMVHAHYWLSGWVGTRLRKMWNVPLVQMFHTLGMLKNSVARGSAEMEPMLRISVERDVASAADRLIAANVVEFGHLVDLYGADPHKIRIVPCGVDLELFHPIDRQEARARLGLDDGQYILFVGRLEPLKGVDILIDAMSILRHNGSRARLLVAGGNLDGDLARQLQDCVVDEHLLEAVRFLGAVDQKDLPYYYSAVDVCAMPSFYESFGMVAIEAMACGTPVVASRAGGLQFTVRDGETGYLVAPGAALPLADALGRVLADRGLRQRLGECGMQISQDYSWERVSQSILRTYLESDGHQEEPSNAIDTALRQEELHIPASCS
jgi:D-inositol-3-phosphate glycosyltransferase